MASRLSDINVKNYIGSEFEAIFVLKSKVVKPQKDGNECMNLVLRDKDTEVDAIIFSVSEDCKSSLTVGKVYYSVVKVREYAKNKNGYSCIIEGTPTEVTDVRPELFADWIENYDEYNSRLGVLLNFISGTDWGKITHKIISDNWEKFGTWGAAKTQHHTSFGGLLMHSVCVAECCKNAGEMYNQIYGSDFINLKLLVSAALLHDVMKTKELICDTQSGIMDYSTSSSLTTHIVEIVIEVEKVAIELGIENKVAIDELKHCLLAHHGKLEYGSPIVPSCVEAYILHTIDEFDAQLWKYNKNYKGLKEHDRVASWVGSQLVSFYKATSDTSMDI